MRKSLFLILPMFIILLSSCSFLNEIKTNNNEKTQVLTNSGNSQQQDDKNIVLYTDSNPIENDTIKIEFEEPYCYGSSNYSFSLYGKIINKEYESRTYTIKNVKLIKEATSAKYTVYNTDSITLEAEMQSSFSFSARIPSNISTDKYKLTFSINSYNITYYPYETPDELREDRTITYHILNDVVKTDTVKDGRTITNNYVYESNDNLYYCDTWYLDSKLKTKLTSKTIITEDTDLYGITLYNVSWGPASNSFSVLNGVNHVPSNKILIIPETYFGKELYIDMSAIHDIVVDAIYVPKTVHCIYMGNFTGIGDAKIYYEGTEAEWKALFYSQTDVVTKNVIYNTKAPK